MIVPAVSGSRVQFQAPADISYGSLSVQAFSFRVVEGVNGLRVC